MEATRPVPSRKLNDMQLMLLRLFDRDMTDEQITSLRQTLVEHYSALLAKEVDEVSEAKGYTDADFDRLLNSPS